MLECIKEDKRWIPLLLFAISLSLNLVFFHEISKAPTFYNPIIDEGNYVLLAGEVLSGERSSLPFFQPPLYHYFLALVFSVFGESLLIAKILQALMGALTCLLTFSIANHLFSRRVAFTAGLIVAFTGPMIFFTAQLLPATLAVTLNMLLLLMLLRTRENPKPHNWIICGVITGLPAIAIPNILFIFPVFLAWMIFNIKKDGNYKVHMLNFTLIMLGAAVIILPVTARNYLASNEFVLISANGGANLYIGNNPDMFKTMAIRAGTDWYQLMDEPFRHGMKSTSDDDRYFVQKVISFAKTQPLSFLKGLALKTAWFFNAREFPRTFDMYIFRQYSHLLSLLVWHTHYFSFPFGIIAPLAALGFAMSRYRNTGILLLAGYVLAYSMSYILFFPSARYRIPVIPVLAIFAAYALTWLWQHKADLKKILAGLLLVVSVGVITNMPVRFPTDTINFDAEVAYAVGNLQLFKNNIDMAEKWYTESHNLDPAYAEPIYGMGDVLFTRGMITEAIEKYRQAIALKPGFYEAHVNLGSALIEIGQFDEAAEVSSAAARIRKNSAEAHTNLGIALLRRGKTGEAVKELNEALEINPDYAPARSHLESIQEAPQVTGQ